MSREAWGDEGADYGAFDAAIEAGWIDPTDQTKALIDVMNERDRQWNEEGWTPEHDDKHVGAEMALAAASYALSAFSSNNDLEAGLPADEARKLANQVPAPPFWPWAREWWKPGDRRRDLVKAGALILAEIERIDRAAAQEKT